MRVASARRTRSACARVSFLPSTPDGSASWTTGADLSTVDFRAADRSVIRFCQAANAAGDESDPQERYGFGLLRAAGAAAAGVTSTDRPTAAAARSGVTRMTV